MRINRAKKEHRAKAEPQGTPKARSEKETEKEANFVEVEGKPKKCVCVCVYGRTQRKRKFPERISGTNRQTVTAAVERSMVMHLKQCLASGRCSIDMN